MRVVKSRKLLVVGSGRSGTLYTSKVFQKLGFDLGHEKDGEYGICSMYFLAPKVGQYSTGRTREIGDGSSREDFQFERIIHQVRDPLKTIESLASTFTLKVRLWTHDYLQVQLPGTSGKLQAAPRDRQEWAMRYWLRAQELAEDLAERTVRVEDLPSIWPGLSQELFGDSLEFPDISDTTNRGLRFAFKSKEQSIRIRHNLHTLKWEDVRALNSSLTSQVRDRAQQYGYV